MIIFKDHKIYKVTDEWNADTGLFKYDEEEISSLVPHLGEHVSIVRDFTFGDLWNYVIKDAKILELIFASQLGNYPLEPFIKDSLKEPTEKVTPVTEVGMHWLEISWSLETDYYNKGKPETYFLTDFSGYGTHEYEDANGDKKIDKTSYSLSFTTLNDLKQYELKLRPKLTLHSRYYEKPMKVKRKKLGKMHFSLYNILSAIMFEITFFGDPENRDEEKEKLDDIVDRVKTGEEDTFSWDEVEKDIKDRHKEKKKVDKKLAPKLIEDYAFLLRAWNNDPENIVVKRFYMTNRGNHYFRKAALKMHTGI